MRDRTQLIRDKRELNFKSGICLDVTRSLELHLCQKLLERVTLEDGLLLLSLFKSRLDLGWQVFRKIGIFLGSYIIVFSLFIRINLRCFINRCIFAVMFLDLFIKLVLIHKRNRATIWCFHEDPSGKSSLIFELNCASALLPINYLGKINGCLFRR